MSSALKMSFVMLIMLGTSVQVWSAGCPDDPETDLCEDWPPSPSPSPQDTEDSSDAMRLHLAGGKPLALTLLAAWRASNVKNPALAILLLPFANVLPKAMAAGTTSGTTCGMLKTAYREMACCGSPDTEVPVQIIPNPTTRMTGTNPCEGKKEVTENVTGEPFKNRECMIIAVEDAGEQSGADVSVNFTGDMNTSDVTPITVPYYQTNLCPVNVHWHLGAEHRSAGEYDEDGGKSPQGYHHTDDNPDATRRLAEARYGFACKKYDANNISFTTEYDWKYCKDMHVGETYEVHWPHSALGACGTPYQYQYPFYDGVFCGATVAALENITQQQVASAVGVQGQVFTIINDEHYFYPDLVRGMIVDAEKGMGVHITAYTGSTTGTSRNNRVCSGYTPITWQVDRKCHLISASSFDKMCADMLQMRDDMTGDLHPHGARELVWKNMTANNQVDLAASS